MAGRRGRCAKCNAPFTVPGEEKPKRPEEMPAYIGVECRLCGTRLYGGPDQIGKELKCPDCGARTVLPPPTPKKKNIPPAMFGEQYELWDADEQPVAATIAAHQPQYIAVKCRQCDTIMYANENQVGETIACPDCGHEHIVPPRAKLNPVKSVLTSDAETPRLDPTAAPGARPMLILPSGKMLHEERQVAEYAAAVEESRRTGKPIKIDRRGRPVMPRWPLLTEVLPFFLSRGVMLRWIALSGGFVCAASLSFYGATMAMQGGLAAIAGMCFFAIGFVLSVVAAAFASAMLMTIVTASAMGVRHIDEWPGVEEWFAYLLYVTVAVMVSAIPGAALAQIAPDEVAPLFVGGSVVLLLPIMLLSQLENGSFLGVLSWPVLATLKRHPLSWLLFYGEVATLFTVVGGISFLVGEEQPFLAILLAPLDFWAKLVFARLLGLLGWRLSEA